MDDHAIPQPCPECGAKNVKLFLPTRNFILKGDGWAGKNHRINQQMRAKNKKLDARTAEMKRDAPSVTEMRLRSELSMEVPDAIGLLATQYFSF